MYRRKKRDEGLYTLPPGGSNSCMESEQPGILRLKSMMENVISNSF